MLEIFTKFIKEACDEAIKYGMYGTQSFHIEKIEQIEDKDGAWNFLVTTWNNENDPFEDSRKTEEMSLFEIMDLLGRIIGHLALTDAGRYLHK